MSKYYIPVAPNHTMVPTTLDKWSIWFEKADRTVAKTDIGDAHVSTVCLGLDHNYGSGPPLLFESMVFGGPFNGEMDRYSTWAEAEQGHNAVVERVSRVSDALGQLHDETASLDQLAANIGEVVDSLKRKDRQRKDRQ